MAARRAFVAWVLCMAAIAGLGMGFMFHEIMDAIGAQEWLQRAIYHMNKV